MSPRSRVCASFGVLLAALLVAGGSGSPSAVAASCPNSGDRSGPSERLPDCRAYEQVSPVDKGGLDAVTLEPLQPAQSSACAPGEPCTIAYMNIGAAFSGAEGNVFANAYAASRGADGWQTTPLSPPTPEAPANSRALVSYAFSTDLSDAVMRVPLQRLTEGAPGGVYNLYLRRPDGSYSLITTNQPAEAPKAGCSACYEHEDEPAFAGASADFGHVIFEANDVLVAGAPGGEGHHVENLYEESAGRLSLVGVLPDGTIAQGGASAGAGVKVSEHAGEVQHAISADGSRVVFEAAADGGAPDPRQTEMTELYDRVGGARTLELSAPAAGAQPGQCETEGGVCNAEPARFWAASADGSVVYFTSSASLTRQSYTGPEASSEPLENPGDDLYRYDLATETLTDVTPDGSNGEDPDGASVLGVVGTSEDGSYVYFVAEGALAAGASSGTANLYVWHQPPSGPSTTGFVATLAAPSEAEAEDAAQQRHGSAFKYHSDVLDWAGDPHAAQAYVTPDGRHLAFMSAEPLSGYDNEAQSAEPGEEAPSRVHEVFEYGVEGGPPVCASCDPDGARPLGDAFVGAQLTEATSTPFHQPRTLSDDGSRLFFTSPDPLVTGAAGGSEKVYEYEDGEVQPISGAQSGASATFLDASASGDDVFFATREQLAAGDADALLDVYDARVDGGLPQPPDAEPCAGGECADRAADAPPSFGEPLSALFAGAGNTAHAPNAKRPSRARLLARALARCRKLKGHRRRAVCTAAAKRRYGPRTGRARRAAQERRSAHR